MRLAKFTRWMIPGLAVWSYWHLPIAKQTQREIQTRIEIKFLSKNEFLSSMVNTQSSPALVIVFATSHLRKAEGQERERRIIQLSKEIAIALKDLPAVNVYLFRLEDFKILEKGLEATSSKDMPFKIEKEKEVHLYFKRPDYKGYFDMNDQETQFAIDAISNQTFFKSLKRSLKKLAQPVTLVNSMDQLKVELVRNVGINDRPIILDICSKQNVEKEREKLTQYLLSRFEEKLISPYTAGLLINSDLIGDQTKTDSIGVIKNDFKDLHSFHTTCKSDKNFESENPEIAAKAYAKVAFDKMMASLDLTTPNFENSKETKSVAGSLDDRVQPDIPLFLEDNQIEVQKFYSHVYKNEGRKLLSLNLTKDDAHIETNIVNFIKASQSSQFSSEIGFQVFAESSHERMLKHLNKYYSPFCLFDLTKPVGRSYQKLFVAHPFMCLYPHFEANLASTINRARDPLQNDKILYSEDSIEHVSSRAFEFFQRKHRKKVRLMLMLKPGDKANLFYERHFLEKFGGKDYIKLSKMVWPNSLGSQSPLPRYPSLLITTLHDPKPILLDLPSSFQSPEELQRFLGLLDDNVSSTFGH